MPENTEWPSLAEMEEFLKSMEDGLAENDEDQADRKKRSYALSMWQLSHLSSGMTKAKRLEKQRAEFHEELYESIVYGVVNYDPSSPAHPYSTATDNQAFRIIQAKERYEKEIQRNYECFTRWNQLLGMVSVQDGAILVRHFQKHKRVDSEVLQKVLDRIEVMLQEEEQKVASLRDKQALDKMKEFR